MITAPKRVALLGRVNDQGWRDFDEDGKQQCIACWAWQYPSIHSCPGVPQAGRTPPSAPERVQLRRTKGWRKPPGAIVVARPSKWGNPFRVVRDGALFGEPLYRVVVPDDLDMRYFVGGQQTLREASGLAVLLFRDWISQRREEHLAPLAGHDLACWCALDVPCHADVLLELANGAAS